MATIEINVDATAVEDLAADIMRAKRQLLGRFAERGYQLLRDEVPYQTGNLKKGVSEPDIDYEAGTAVLQVSAARDSRPSLTAKVIGADGKEKKTITLRGTPAYNYAEVVALGNKDAVLHPKSAKAFLIPVSSAPDGEGYLISGGQIYVVRKSRKGQKPNPFHERAGKRLEDEADRIADAVLKKIFV